MAFQLKSFRKFLATTATATMVASAITPFASAASFSDVSESYKDAVDYLVSQEISVGLGDGMFGTQSQIKRADAAIWLVRALGLENYGAPDSGFVDVPARAVKAVNVLKDLEIIHGKTATTFGSQDPLTRSEMAKIIASAYDLPVEGQAHPFKDVNADFNDYVQALYNAGITSGKGGATYGAYDSTKRGEFAIFLTKAEQYKAFVPEVLVSDVTGVINEDNTVTIKGKAEEIDKVTVVIPNGVDNILLEAEVINGEFSVTTEMPNSEIHEISILDKDGNVLYEGVSDRVVTAGIEVFKVNPINNDNN